MDKPTEGILDNNIGFLRELLAKNIDNPEKRDLGIGLLKKELEKQPFNEELHELFRTSIKEKDDAIDFINHLLNAFSITLDYKYYDLIIMILAYNFPSTYEYIVSEDERTSETLPSMIDELHTLITNLYWEGQERLRDYVKDLEDTNLSLSKKLRELNEEREEVWSEVSNIKSINADLKEKLDEIEKDKSQLENDIETRKTEIENIITEKEKAYSERKELEEKLDRLKNEKEEIESNLFTKDEELQALRQEKIELETEWESNKYEYEKLHEEKAEVELEYKKQREEFDKLISEKEKLISKNSLLKDRIDNISEVVANVVVRQDSQFDKIDKKVSNLDKLDHIKEMVSEGNFEALNELTSDLGGEEDELSNLKDNTISDRVFKYIVAVENLLRKSNEQANNLLQENKTLKQELNVVRKEQELTEGTQEVLTETQEEATSTEINYESIYEKAYEEAYTEAYSQMEKKVKELSDEFNMLNKIGEGLAPQDGETDEEKEKTEQAPIDNEELDELLMDIEYLKQEIESKEALIDSYKEALYEIFDENHELLTAQEQSDNLLSTYETSLISLLKRKHLINLGNGENTSRNRKSLKSRAKKNSNKKNSNNKK